MSQIEDGDQEQHKNVSSFFKSNHPTQKDISETNNTNHIVEVKEEENIEYLKSMSKCRGEVDDFFIDKSEVERDNEMSEMMIGRIGRRGKVKEERNYPPPVHIKKTFSFMEDQPNTEITLPEELQPETQPKILHKQLNSLDLTPSHPLESANTNNELTDVMEELREAQGKREMSEERSQEPELFVEQQINERSNFDGGRMSINGQNNKYEECIRVAMEYNRIQKVGYYICLFRFVFIAFVYYFGDFAMIPSPEVGNNKEARGRIYEPWNVMIYLLSGCVDLINVIGYISSMRFLKKEVKILQHKSKKEEIRLNIHYLSSQPHPNSETSNILAQQIELQERVLQQEQEESRAGVDDYRDMPPRMAELLNENHRSIRIGKESTYMSLYSTLRQYKYLNQDQASAFRIAQIMHISATFLFFGRMALIEQIDHSKSNSQKEVYSPWKELILWFFLLSAYIGSFEIDLSAIENSKGSYVKVVRFHVRKIQEVYGEFKQWRKRYGKVLIFGFMISVGAEVLWLIEIKEGQFYILALTNFGFILSTYFVYVHNKRIIESSNFSNYSQKQQIHTNEIELNDQIERKNVENMFEFENLSLLGIFQRYRKYYSWVLFGSHRIILLLLGLAILRESGNIETKFFIMSLVGFIVGFYSELSKFRTIVKSKINLLESCKYSSFLSEDEGGAKSACSVCLCEYESENKVVIICCGHLFHEHCLLDWLKLKKECPLCRLNIEEYYGEGNI